VRRRRLAPRRCARVWADGSIANADAGGAVLRQRDLRAPARKPDHDECTILRRRRPTDGGCRSTTLGAMPDGRLLPRAPPFPSDDHRRTPPRPRGRATWLGLLPTSLARGRWDGGVGRAIDAVLAAYEGDEDDGGGDDDDGGGRGTSSRRSCWGVGDGKEGRWWWCACRGVCRGCDVRAVWRGGNAAVGVPRRCWGGGRVSSGAALPGQEGS